MNISDKLQKYIERNVDCLDNWTTEKCRNDFYSNLPVSLLEEFNKLLIKLNVKIDIQETYMNVFNWLLYDVTVQDPKNDSYDIYTEDNLICMEYETQDSANGFLTNLWIQYNIMTDEWSCYLDIDDQTKEDFYDYLTDDEMRMQGKGWAQLVQHLSSTLSWDCYQAAREYMLKYDPSVWPKN